MDAGRGVLATWPLVSCVVGFEEGGAAEEVLGRGEVTAWASCESSGTEGCSPTLAMVAGGGECEATSSGCRCCCDGPPTRGNWPAVLMLWVSERRRRRTSRRRPWRGGCTVFERRRRRSDGDCERLGRTRHAHRRARVERNGQTDSGLLGLLDRWTAGLLEDLVGGRPVSGVCRRVEVVARSGRR